MSYFALSGLTGCIFPNSGTSSYYDVLFSDQNIISIYKKDILPNINNNWEYLYLVEIIYEKNSQIFKFNNDVDRNTFYSFITTISTDIGSIFYKGGYNPVTNIPDLTGGTDIVIGNMYVAISAGTFFGENLEIGDVLISEKNIPITIDDWTIVQKNLDAAEIKILYESNPDTNAFTDANVLTLGSALQPGDALSATTTIGDLEGYIKGECDANFLSANTSFYTQTEVDANFLSASTSLNILENRKYISQTENADFSTIKEAVEWFNAFATTNTEFILDAGYHIVDEIVELNNEFALNIKGLGSDVTKLNITITGSTFSILSECTFSRLTLNGPGTGITSICFDLNTEKYCEFYDIQINNFDKAFLDKNLNDIFIFNFIINNCSIGIEVDNSTNGGAIDIEIGTIENTPIGINLKYSEAKDFIINGIYYYGNLSSNTFINIEPEFGLNGISNVQNCGGNNIGNFQVGFDFSLSSGTYKDVEMLSNTTYEDKKPYFKINVVDNVATTTITTAGTYYKANFINGNSFTCKMKLENNKITFLPTHKKNIIIHVTGNLSVNQNNKNVTIGWNKNEEGTIYSPFTIRTSVANQPYGFSFISYFQNISEGDFGELFLTSSSNGDVVTIQDLNIFGQTL